MKSKCRKCIVVFAFRLPCIIFHKDMGQIGLYHGQIVNILNFYFGFWKQCFGTFPEYLRTLSELSCSQPILKILLGLGINVGVEEKLKLDCIEMHRKTIVAFMWSAKWSSKSLRVAE